MLVVGDGMCVIDDGLLLLPIVGIGWYAFGVNLPLLLCFFLGVGVYWLDSWLLECVLLLGCMGDGYWWG
jgi:hypothetical protein